MSRPSRRRPGPAKLAAILDVRAAGPLAAQLLARRGEALCIDGAAVERLGGQCLQVLLAARRTWQADGREFRLANASGPLAEALASFGAAGLADPSIAEPNA